MTVGRSLPQLAADLDRLEAVTEQWPPEQRATVQAIRQTVEQIQAGAFRSLIRTVKETPGGLQGLAAAVEDEWVRSVLTYHGLLRAPAPTPEEIIEGALESVRPMLAQHGGNVSFVAFADDGIEAQIKLQGSCDGCTFSDITVRQGIETAIKEALPSVQRVKVVGGTSALVQLGGVDSSPFSRPWQDAGPADLEGQPFRIVELEAASVLVAIGEQGTPKAYRNACAHLGMPLDEGRVLGGVLTCPYHGFEFALASGECLTAPSVQLFSYPSKVEDGRVFVQVTP